MTKGKLYEKAKKLTQLIPTNETNDKYFVPFTDILDEAKKECPILGYKTGGHSYGDPIPSIEELSQKQLILLLETYKWAIKWFGK